MENLFQALSGLSLMDESFVRLFARAEDKSHAASMFGMRVESSDLAHKIPEGTAVVPVVGPLRHAVATSGGGFFVRSYSEIGDEIEAAAKNPDIDRIVLLVNSPGGVVSGAFDLHDRIKAVRDQKEIVAIVDEMALSAGYMIACAASRIVMPRTGQAGSIGVLSTRFDVTAAAEKYGEAITYIYAGDKKTWGSPFTTLSDDERRDTQAKVDKLFDMFVTVVADARNIPESQVRALQAGVFQGREALEVGLVDEIAPAFLALSNGEIPMTEAQKAQKAKDDEKARKAQEEQEEKDAADKKAQADAASAAALAAEQQEAATTRAVTAERERIVGIQKVCDLAGQPDLATDFINRGITVEQAKLSLFDKLAADGDSTPVLGRGRVDMPGSHNADEAAMCDAYVAAGAKAYNQKTRGEE